MKLRAVTPADIEVFFEHQADPAATEMAVFGAREYPEHTARWQRILGDASTIVRTIEVDAVVAGNVVSWESEGMRYVGYWIGREFWGRGVATSALRDLVGLIEQRPLYALVVLTNIGSQRVLEKSGFMRLEQRASPADGLQEFVCVLR